MRATIDSQTQNLLAEAAEWRLLSLLFDCPGQSWLAQVAQLSVEVTDPELRTCVDQALGQASEGLYHSTFGPGGPAAPREVSYSDTLQFGYLMSELQAYYEAFGYRPRTKEAPDHISVELGFLAYLNMKEAFALASGDEKQRAVTAEAAKRFAAEHLARVAQPLAERLRESGLGYLSEAARALQRRVGAPAERPAVPVEARLPVLNEDAAFACGLDSSEGEDPRDWPDAGALPE